MDAFETCLRTGRRKVAGPVEHKFNPWHDADDGRFTFAGGGGKRGSFLWRASASPELLTGLSRASWDSAAQTAKDILAGRRGDPTGGATFFFSSDKFTGDPDTAPGGFKTMLKRKTVVRSAYESSATGKDKQYFLVEPMVSGRRP